MRTTPDSNASLETQKKEFGQDKAHCYIADGLISVPSVCLLIVGLSCKNFSALRAPQHQQWNIAILHVLDTSGQTLPSAKEHHNDWDLGRGVGWGLGSWEMGCAGDLCQNVPEFCTISTDGLHGFMGFPIISRMMSFAGNMKRLSHDLEYLQWHTLMNKFKGSKGKHPKLLP